MRSHTEILANFYPKVFSHVPLVNHPLSLPAFGTGAILYLDLGVGEWHRISWLDTGTRGAEVYAPQPEGEKVEEHVRIISEIAVEFTRRAMSGNYA